MCIITPKKMRYIISLGSNMGNSKEMMEGAVKNIAKHDSCSIQKCSSLYRTKPWGKTDQPDFLNAIVIVEWRKTPEELMQFLLVVEKKYGRYRRIHWGPRTLDLDLIDGGLVKRNTEFLKLPHPLFWDRLFVLVPLAEVAPEFTYRNQKISDRIIELGGIGETKRYAVWEGQSWVE